MRLSHEAFTHCRRAGAGVCWAPPRPPSIPTSLPTRPSASVIRTLVQELRCPKCQNQNIADSDAPIAMDLRAQVHRQLGEGKTDEQIIDYLVSRYGDFVLYKPPVTARTLLLWYGPAGLLVGGFVLLGVILLRRRRQSAEVKSDLSADEQQRLAALLSQQSASQQPANQPPVDKKD